MTEKPSMFYWGKNSVSNFSPNLDSHVTNNKKTAVKFFTNN